MSFRSRGSSGQPRRASTTLSGGDESGSDDDFTITTIGAQFETTADDRRKSGHVFNQIVTDDEGRRRFHGAFTGGFSAGYYNTVGSAEGWTPQTFVSSRSKRAKISKLEVKDIADEEDLDTAAVAGKTLKTRDDIESFGAQQSRTQKSRKDRLLDAFVAPAKLMIGEKLLSTMGWRPGQGIGPRRKRRKRKKTVKKMVRGPVMPGEEPLQVKEFEIEDEDVHAQNFTFAPSNVRVYKTQQKQYRYGIGFDPHNAASDVRQAGDKFKSTLGKNQMSMQDVDPDDDVYSTHHVSQYDISISTKSKLLQPQLLTDDRIRGMDHSSFEKPKRRKVEYSEKTRCSDGHRPLDGFVMATVTTVVVKKWPPPRVPKNFDEMHRFALPGMQLTDDVTKIWNPLQRLTHEQRGKILGERQLPGAPKPPPEPVKMPEISQQERTRISSDLRGQFTEGSSLQPHKLGSGLIHLPKSTDPLHELKHKYDDDLNKQARFDRFYALKLGTEPPPYASLRVDNLTDFQKREETAEFERFFEEFKNSNRHLEVIRRMPIEGKDKKSTKAMEKIQHMTVEWRPARLLCKRFNCPDPYEGVAKAPKQATEFEKRKEIVYGKSDSGKNEMSSDDVQAFLRQGLPSSKQGDNVVNLTAVKEESDDENESEEKVEKPPVDLFKAIFEDDSDDSDDSDSSDESSDESEKEESEPQPSTTTSSTNDTQTNKPSGNDTQPTTNDIKPTNGQSTNKPSPSDITFRSRNKGGDQNPVVKSENSDLQIVEKSEKPGVSTQKSENKGVVRYSGKTEYSLSDVLSANEYKPAETKPLRQPKITYNQSSRKKPTRDWTALDANSDENDFEGPDLTIHGVKQSNKSSKKSKGDKKSKKDKKKSKKDRKKEKDKKKRKERDKKDKKHKRKRSGDGEKSRKKKRDKRRKDR